MLTKAAVFENIKPFLNPGCLVFGSTLLPIKDNGSFFSKQLMDFYNKKGIFTNYHDDLEELKTILEQNFEISSVNIIGCAALFWGRFSR